MNDRRSKPPSDPPQDSAPRVLRPAVKRLARAILPASVSDHISDWRALDPDSRRVYLRLWRMRVLGLRRPVWTADTPAPRVVMFVCYGNIIRSAFAEWALRGELERLGVQAIEVISSGTDARPGREADRRAIALAPEFGVSLDHHRATHITEELVNRSDAIFAMDFSNEAKLAARFPGALSRILLLAPSPEQPGPLQIPDPYTGDVESVRACYRVLHGRIRALAAQLAEMQLPLRAYSGNDPR